MEQTLHDRDSMVTPRRAKQVLELRNILEIYLKHLVFVNWLKQDSKKLFDIFYPLVLKREVKPYL